MRPLGASNRPALAGALLGLVLAAPPAAAQGDLRVTFPTVKDSRHRLGATDPSGELVLFPRIDGTGIEGAKGYRIKVTGAKDDAGNPLLPDSDEPRKWAEKPDGMDLWLKLKLPPREASSVILSGTLEVWIPSRDPAADVKVQQFYAKAGKPIASPALRGAKIQVTVVPRERVNEGSVVLVGPSSDMKKILSVAVVRADGTPMEVSSTGSQADTGTTTTEIAHTEPIPPDASLVLTLMTEKAVLSVPFETSIPLP